jgi:cell division protein FtsL
LATVDWFAAEAVAAPAPARRRARPVATPKARAKTRRRTRRVTPGILWIGAFALLLAGVVAVNVAVLRVNMGVSKLEQEQLQLQAQNATLASQVSSARAAPRIEQAARKLGLVPAPATDTSYLDLAKR